MAKALSYLPFDKDLTVIATEYQASGIISFANMQGRWIYGVYLQYLFINSNRTVHAGLEDLVGYLDTNPFVKVGSFVYQPGIHLFPKPYLCSQAVISLFLYAHLKTLNSYSIQTNGYLIYSTKNQSLDLNGEYV